MNTLLKALLVPVDGSPESEAALRWAVALAAQLDAQVHLLFVEPETLPADVTHLGVVMAQRRQTGQVRSQLEHWMQTLVPAPQRGRVLVTSGQPAGKILDAARELEAGLIVVSTHNYGRLKRLLLGSTTEELLRAARWPVLVVPPAAQPEPESETAQGGSFRAL